MLVLPHKLVKFIITVCTLEEHPRSKMQIVMHFIVMLRIMCAITETIFSSMLALIVVA